MFLKPQKEGNMQKIVHNMLRFVLLLKASLWYDWIFLSCEVGLYLVILEHLQRNNVGIRNSQFLSSFLLEFDSMGNTFEMYLLDKMCSHHVCQYLLP